MIEPVSDIGVAHFIGTLWGIFFAHFILGWKPQRVIWRKLIKQLDEAEQREYEE